MRWSERAVVGAARVGAFGRIAALASLILCVVPVVAFSAGFAGYLASLDRVERDPPERADAIVALTGGSQRVEDALALLARGFGRRLLITGVNERTGRDEIARLSPGQRDLVACCVDLDHRARNTVGNAAETRRWAETNGFHSLIVVTSNYHMARTLAELDHVLPGTRKIPHAVIGALDPAEWWSNLPTARLLLSEYAKYLAVRVRTTLFGVVPGQDGLDPRTPGVTVAQAKRAG